MLVAPLSISRLSTVHAMALLSTAWGTCGVVWKNHESETSDGFSAKPVHALLSRIYVPGNTPVELHRHVQKCYPNCHEVMCAGGQSFHPETVPEWFNDLSNYLRNYYTASLRGLSQPQFVDNWAFWAPRLDWSQMTPFQRRVLEVVANIPSGMKLTYGEVARRIGKPAASRAVGAAIGNNPWPVLVPCHRVVGAGGKLTGFTAPGGVETKRKMLALEAG